MLDVHVPAGIGDLSWIYSKIVNLGEDLHLIVREEAFHRSKAFANLLPRVKKVTYAVQPNYNDLVFYHNDLRKRPLALAANEHLEAGRRLESYLPSLPTDFHYPIASARMFEDDVCHLLGKSKDLVGLYTSGHFSQGFYERFNIYKVKDWVELVSLYAEAHPGKTYVFLGNVKADGPFTMEVLEQVKAKGIDTINAIGTCMGVTVEILRRLDYLLAFPSGIPIVANVLGTPTFMYYQSFLSKLRYGWPCPQSIKNGSYKASVFCSPAKVIAMIDSSKPIIPSVERIVAARCVTSDILVSHLAQYFRRGCVVSHTIPAFQELVDSGGFELIYEVVDGNTD